MTRCIDRSVFCSANVDGIRSLALRKIVPGQISGSNWVTSGVASIAPDLTEKGVDGQCGEKALESGQSFCLQMWQVISHGFGIARAFIR
jgi:hypothetical protein